MECLAAGRVMAMEISNPRLTACKTLGSTVSEMLRRPLTATHLPVLSNNTSHKNKTRPVFLRSRASASAVAVEPAQEIEDEDVRVPVPRLKEIYLQKVVPQLMQEFKYANPHQVPKIEKVVVNSGIGDAAQNAKTLEAAIKDLSVITGQRPVKTRAKKAIAAFKLRQGSPVGLSVTLRGHVMYNFLDRLMNLALPRTRDFQGINPNSFDGHGNFSLGVREQNVFPEIEYEGRDKTRGMDVCIATSAKTDSEGQKLLSLLGMPFRS